MNWLSYWFYYKKTSEDLFRQKNIFEDFLFYNFLLNLPPQSSQ